MQKEVFYQHLCEELAQNKALYPYYKLINGNTAHRQFRKAYFLQRLDYLDRYLDLSKKPAIWDCGCGYGTTGLYLAMNGQPCYGTTLEYYTKQLENRRQFWNRFGNTNLFTCEHINVFDQTVRPNQYDYIILQDTLHHLEPVADALKIFYDALKKNGKLILIEENGGSVLKNVILFARRGRKKIIKIYDDVLQKEILIGNENIRSEKVWRDIFRQAGFTSEENAMQYIRCLPPFCYTKNNMQQIIRKEQSCSQRRKWFCRHAFFGLNMIFTK